MCEHDYENANCTNCANGIGRLEYECAKTQGKLKEYCHDKAKVHEEQIRADERKKVLEEVCNRIDEGLCDMCECDAITSKCYKNCTREGELIKNWLKEKARD